MGEYHCEMLAVSLAGHDKGKVYVVLEDNEREVLLADGAVRLLKAPKRKNRKHVQLVKKLPGEAAALMETVRDDVQIKRILKLYCQWKNKEEE